MKKSVITILMIFTALWSMAQGIRYGVEGGLNISTPINANETKIGFNIGVKAELPLTSGWFLDGALKLSSKPFGVKETGYYDVGDWMATPTTDDHSYTAEATTTPYYLQIPLHIGYKWSLSQTTKLNIAAGPYFGIGLWGKAKGYIDGSEFEGGESDNVFKDGGFRRFEVGASVKAGVELFDHYQVSLGYDVQCNSLLKEDDIYNQVVSLSVAYMF